MSEQTTPTYPAAGPLNRTEAALISRAVDSHTARRLRKDGLTLGRLKQHSRQELTALGLTDEAISGIRSGSRPPIPLDSLAHVLFASRNLCCVCREAGKPIVVHHIRPWAESRDHSPSNLAVLCPEHHGEAHSKHELSISLDGKKLTLLKEEWEAQVPRLDVIAILDACRLDHDDWYYFNHKRLFDLATELELEFVNLPRYQSALSAGSIDEAGILRPRAGGAPYMYAGPDLINLYSYVREVMLLVLRQLRVTNISDCFDRGTLPTMLKPGDFVFVQGAHTFTPERGQSGTAEQPCKGTRSANHVEVRYVFNKWEATSASAWGMWLEGRRLVGSLVRTKNIEHVESKLRISGTVYGICSALKGLKNREYSPSPYQAGIWVLDEDCRSRDRI